jgi:hypothetical protein
VKMFVLGVKNTKYMWAMIFELRHKV